MKKLICGLLALLLVVSLSVTAFAAISPLSDRAEVLTPEEETELTNILLGYGEKTVYILTVESLDGQDVETYAETYAEENGIGILMMIAQEERKWCITSSAAYQGAIDGDVIDQISAECVPYLRNNDYYGACLTFAEECGYYLDGYDPQEYLSNNDPKDLDGAGSGITFGRIAICLLIGLAAGGITAGIMAGKNRSVRPQRSAANYVRSGSMNVTVSRDIYLYHHVTRTPKPQNNSSGGGGGSRSTRSGSF